jgi:hypothetical protein
MDMQSVDALALATRSSILLNKNKHKKIKNYKKNKIKKIKTKKK